MRLFGRKTCQFFAIGPVIPVPDVEAAVEFYCTQLSFKRDFVMGEPPSHGSVTQGRVGIQFTLSTEPFNASDYPGWFYLFVENIDSLAAAYAQRGLAFTRPLESGAHGMREFELKDLHGYRLRFGQYL